MIDMSTKLKSGTVADLFRAAKTINRLKDFKSTLRFPALGLSLLTITASKLWDIKTTDIHFLQGKSDAFLGNLNEEVGSTQGVIIWIMDK
jgi:hypothetical protein